MVTFFQILLAVALVIGALILLGYWWIKRRILAVAGDYKAVAELQQHLDLRPARLHLVRGERDQYDNDERVLIAKLAELGFKRLGDLCDYDACQSIHVARHVSLPVASAVFADAQGKPCFVLFCLEAGRRVIGRGNEPQQNIDLPRLDWQLDANLTPQLALDKMKERLDDTHSAPNLRTARAILEQVYAMRMDRKIVHRPTREILEQKAQLYKVTLNEAQLDIALELVLDHWKEQVRDAVLDRYRKSSKIDAATWEDIQDELHVVHARLDNDDIESMLVTDDLSEKLFQDCVDQGLSGLDLYQAVVKRLPPDQRWEELSEVSQPVRAVIYQPADQTEGEADRSGLYVYKALDDENRTHEGSIVASSAGDAKAQLERSGLRNPKILIEPNPIGDEGSDLVEAAVARIAARAAEESIAKSLFRAFTSNWLLWAPALLLLANSLHEGPPYGWGDYAVFAWTLVSLGLLVFVMTPMFLYDQLQRAVVNANIKSGYFLVRGLELTAFFGGITRHQLRAERCRIMAMDGKQDAAVELWKSKRGDMDDPEYLAGLSMIFDAAGDTRRTIETQRAWVEAAPAMEMARLDLAMSLARHTREVEKIEDLLASMSPNDLSELALSGYQFTRGLLAAQREQNDVAMRHYAQALETLQPMTNMPLASGFMAEIKGHLALIMKRTGDSARANEIWQSVAPILARHRSAAPLVQAFESA